MSAPNPTAETVSGTNPAEAFFAGTARGELLIRRCEECEQLAWPVSQGGITLMACPYCLSSRLGWQPSSGRGTVYAFGTMYQVFDASLTSEIPYVLAVIELEEGVRTQHVRLVDSPEDSLAVGIPVEVAFERVDGLAIPKFRVASS